MFVFENLIDYINDIFYVEKTGQAKEGGVLLFTPQRREFSCVCNSVSSTLSDSYRSHT